MDDTICVPVANLAITPIPGVRVISLGDEEREEKAVPPEVGDPVELNISGSVESLEDDLAYVKIAFINGKRPGSKGKKEKPEEEEEEQEEGKEEDLETATEKMRRKVAANKAKEEEY